MIDFNKQSAEWQWKWHQLMIAQKMFSEYAKYFPESNIKLDEHIFWEKLNEEAISE